MKRFISSVLALVFATTLPASGQVKNTVNYSNSTASFRTGALYYIEIECDFRNATAAGIGNRRFVKTRLGKVKPGRYVQMLGFEGITAIGAETFKQDTVFTLADADGKPIKYHTNSTVAISTTLIPLFDYGRVASVQDRASDLCGYRGYFRHNPAQAPRLTSVIFAAADNAGAQFFQKLLSAGATLSFTAIEAITGRKTTGLAPGATTATEFGKALDSLFGVIQRDNRSIRRDRLRVGKTYLKTDGINLTVNIVGENVGYYRNRSGRDVWENENADGVALTGPMPFSRGLEVFTTAKDVRDLARRNNLFGPDFAKSCTGLRTKFEGYDLHAFDVGFLMLAALKGRTDVSQEDAYACLGRTLACEMVKLTDKGANIGNLRGVLEARLDPRHMFQHAGIGDVCKGFAPMPNDQLADDRIEVALASSLAAHSKASVRVSRDLSGWPEQLQLLAFYNGNTSKQSQAIALSKTLLGETVDLRLSHRIGRDLDARVKTLSDTKDRTNAQETALAALKAVSDGLERGGFFTRYRQGIVPVDALGLTLVDLGFNAFGCSRPFVETDFPTTGGKTIADLFGPSGTQEEIAGLPNMLFLAATDGGGTLPPEIAKSRATVVHVTKSEAGPVLVEIGSRNVSAEAALEKRKDGTPAVSCQVRAENEDTGNAAEGS